MTYTAENIRNLKRDGLLGDYIAMTRETIAKLEAAELVESGTDGKGFMEIAHFHGWWEAGEDSFRGHGGTFASSVHGHFWTGKNEWVNFPTLHAASQYAKAALRNHLTALAKDVLAENRRRLAVLEAAL